MAETPNSRAALEQRRLDGGLKWSRALAMVLARPALAVVAGGIVAAGYQ